MALNQQQIKILKSQLLAQIENLPEDKKAEAKQQIENLSPKALELMLKQQQKSEEKVFRLIIEGKIPSTKIEEDDDSIAVLEINPISRGHTIIIPKNAAKSSNNLPQGAFTLAKKVSGILIKKLKAKSAEIQTENKFGETILDVIPIYDKQLDINSPRNRINKEELKEIKEEIDREEKKIELIQIKEEKSTNPPLKLKRKIP